MYLNEDLDGDKVTMKRLAMYDAKRLKNENKKKSQRNIISRLTRFKPK